ncbi:MAG: hypothetical protein HY821_13200 [Acidobacteria bacterium]|nr:hypothetical protein [Acidobacteriota bacterium]
MTAATLPVRPVAVSKGKLRLFDASGIFLRRVLPAQADELLAAGLAEWRGRDLRFVAVEGKLCRGLDGLTVTKRETSENPRGCYTYSTRTLLEVNR